MKLKLLFIPLLAGLLYAFNSQGTMPPPSAQDLSGAIVVTNKEVYLPAEDIHFRINSPSDAARHSFSCSIYELSGKEIVSKDFENSMNRYSGKIQLPEKADPGIYMMMFKKKGKDVFAFRQLVVTLPYQKKFKPEISFHKQQYEATDKVVANFNLLQKTDEDYRRAVVKYDLVSNGKTIDDGRFRIKPDTRNEFVFEGKDINSDVYIIGEIIESRSNRYPFIKRIPFRKRGYTLEAYAIPSGNQSNQFMLRAFHTNGFPLSAQEIRIVDEDKKVSKVLQTNQMGHTLFTLENGVKEGYSFEVNPNDYFQPSTLMEVQELEKTQSQYSQGMKVTSLGSELLKKEYKTGENIQIRLTRKQPIPKDASLAFSAVHNDRIPNIINWKLYSPSYYTHPEVRKIFDQHTMEDPAGTMAVKMLLYPYQYKANTDPLQPEEILEYYNKQYSREMKAMLIRNMKMNYDLLYANGETETPRVKREPPYKELLRSGVDLPVVLESIKPYTETGGMILFSGMQNSFTQQKGALIIVDGMKRGHQISQLEYIEPESVESIEVITDPSEMNRYSALDANGLVLIETKKGTDRSGKQEEPENQFESSLYWESQLPLLKDKNSRIVFPTNQRSGQFVVFGYGLNETGMIIYSGSFRVK